MAGLSAQTVSRLYAHLARLWQIEASSLRRAGTHIITPTGQRSKWDTVWTLAQHTVIITTGERKAIYDTIERERQQSITALQALPHIIDTGTPDIFYTVDISNLKRIARADTFTIRQLTQADDVTFAAFKARCSDADKAQGQVGLTDEAIFGAFDSTRIVAAASSFEWQGFIDVGVLTDPEYRRHGLGTAVVGALTAHHLNLADDTRLPLYRHEATNTGSSHVAKHAGFQQFATCDYLYPDAP